MFTALSEKLRKFTAVTLITTLVFSFTAPAFAAIWPTFTATENIANATIGTNTQTATLADPVANVAEVKATRTVDVQSLPANNSTVSLGTCTITFHTVSGSTSDDLDCSDSAAAIDRNTGAGNNPRTASSIAGRLRSLTNVGSANHGTLVVSGTGTEATFTTSPSFTETTASIIGFSWTASGVSVISTNSVTSVIPVVQISTITIGGTIDVGDIFTVTSAPLGTASFTALTTSTSDVAAGLNTAIQSHVNYPARNYTTSVVGNVITLTAKNAGTAFTTLTPTTTNFAGTAQVVTFTPGNIVAGIKYRLVVNGNMYESTATTNTTTIADITLELTNTINASSEPITCVDNTNSFTCTADVAGTAFTYVTSIVDVAPPVITPIGNNTRNTSHNWVYAEPGATCIDNIDGSCSVLTTYSSPIDTSILGSIYSVFYNTTDFAGNVATQITQTVTVVDTTIPIITVNPTTVIVAQNSGAYTDTGVTANDDVDLDITANIVRGGDVVNTAVIGDYVITYDVSDAALNPALQQNRTVQVRDLTAPTATPVSIVSNNTTPTLAKEGDVITVSFTTSEPVNLPTATIAGKTATVTNTAGNNYTATYTLTAAETQGVAAITIDFDDIAGNDAVQVTAVTDASSVTIDTSVPLAPVVARPSDSEIITTATSTAEGTCETGTTVVISSTNLVTNPTTVTCVGGQFLTTITFTPGSLNTTFPITFTQIDTTGNISAAVVYTINYREPQQAGGGSALFVLLENNQTPPSNPTPTPTPTPTPVPTPTPTPTNPTPTSETNPTTPESTPTPNPEAPTTPETNNTTGDNSELIPTSFPNEAGTNTTGTTGGTTTGGTTTGGTGGGTTTGGTTTGGTFNPAEATLDAGGGVTPEEPVVEPIPTEIPQDIGGWVVPEEESHTLAWTLLGLVVLLNFAWFYTRKNSVPTR